MKLSPIEIEERAAEARNFLNSAIVTQIFDDMRAEYIRQLIQADVGGLTAATLHASMKVLDGVRERLQSYVNDNIVQKRSR